MTVIVCSYGNGLRAVCLSGSGCLPCLSLHPIIPQRVGMGEEETDIPPAHLIHHARREALRCPRIARKGAGRVTIAGSGAAIVRG
jgi:hypothetical protein